MSSRSFRRRNNRRKHNRPAAGTDSRAPAQQGPVGQDPQKEPGQRSNQGRGPRRENQRQGQPGRNPSGGRRSPPDRARDAAGHVQFPEPPRVYPDCPVCQQQVRELPSALTHRATGQPAHFDCIMRELRDSNELLPQERICYLGGGTFGIIELRPGPGRFVVKRRIPYEEKEAVQEWKKPLLILL